MAEAEDRQEQQLLWAERDDEVLLAGVRCDQCNTLFVPRQAYGCEACGADGSHLVDELVRSEGIVRSFTTVFLHQTLKTPYHVASVVTNAGPVVQGRLELNAPEIGAVVVGKIEIIDSKPRFVFVAVKQEA